VLVDASKLPDVSADHPELEEAAERLFAAHMKAREEAFAQIFGPTEPPDRILSPADPELLENWPGGGVYAFPPRGGRGGWHYATHGLAQPFGEEELAPAAPGDEERFSGLGIELVIATKEPEEWAPSLLIDFVRYLLFQEDAELIVPGDRIPTEAFELYAPGSRLSHVIATTSDEYPSDIRLPGGRCRLVHLLGVTSSEVARAKREASGEGTVALGEALRAIGIVSPGLVTDTGRSCGTDDPRFEAAYEKALAEASG